MEIYAGLAETVQRKGMVLHSTLRLTIEITGYLTSDGTFETWVDGVEAVARVKSGGGHEYTGTGEASEGSAHGIIRDGLEYSMSEGDTGQNEPQAAEAQGCYGQPRHITIIILAGCPGPTEDSETIVEWEEYDGQLTLVLITDGTSRGSDEVSTFVRRTYLNPATFLPLYSISEGIYDKGTQYPETIEASYTHEFIERGSLDSDFFELSSIGFPSTQ